MMNRFRAIRVRLTLWYIGLLALTVLGFSFFLYYELQDILSDQIDDGIQVAASQLMVDVDDSVNPPVLRPMSDAAAAHILQSSFASRMVAADGEVVADVGGFPELTFAVPVNTGFHTVTIDSIPWRIFTQQVATNNQQYNVWLQVGQSLNVLGDTQSTLFTLILIGLPVVLILTAFGGMFMASRALNPVDTITRTVQDIHATDMSKRINYHGPNDELGRLTETLNSMLERLQAAFDTERRFTADASHELRTPLTTIKGHIGVTLTRQRSPAEYETTLFQIQRETERLIRLANDLLFLARLDAAPLRWQPEIVKLSDLLDAIYDQMLILASEKQIILTATIAENISISGMADHLIRLFLNLIDNALKYTPTGGTVRLSLTCDNQNARVIISDTGIGIAAEHLPHLFERFYRAGRDPHQTGAGLGLPIAYQITRTHGGTLEINSTPNQGTTITVILPLITTF
jgi:signal transduction histidine kinase